MSKVYKPARNGYFRDPFNNHRMKIGKQTHASILSWMKKDSKDLETKLSEFGYSSSQIDKIFNILDRTRVARQKMKESETGVKKSRKASKQSKASKAKKTAGRPEKLKHGAGKKLKELSSESFSSASEGESPMAKPAAKKQKIHTPSLSSSPSSVSMPSSSSSSVSMPSSQSESESVESNWNL